ncbi:glutamate/Leucine/Phenylalanine/Valine dehydrogenase family protein [Desulfovibrio sp. A2]|nr:glutamate/Leucine/Phenylalanine/Valine dehydrogenase family protein [Desulfovibrio sp. A2]
MAEPHAKGVEEALSLVKGGLGGIADQVVPWFFANMPDYYLRTHSVTEQVHHLQAIISGRVVTDNHAVRLASPDGRKITYISPSAGGDLRGDLQTILAGLLGEHIETARIYTTADGQLGLHEFLLAPQPRAGSLRAADASSASHAAGIDQFSAALEAMRASGELPEQDMDSFAAFLASANVEYVEKFDPVRAARHFRLLREIGGGDDTGLLIEQCAVPGAPATSEGAPLSAEPCDIRRETRIVVAMRHPPATGLLLQIARIMRRLDIVVHRAYADTFADASGETAIMSFYVSHKGDLILDDSALWQNLRKKLRLVKWFAPHELEILADEESWPIKRIMLLQAACGFAHVFLAKDNQWAYSTQNVVRIVLARRAETAALVDWFEARFDPTLGEREAAARRLEADAADAVNAVADERERAVLLMIQRFFRHVLRTNYFLETIYGLSFRLDPEFLPPAYRPEGEELPFGIFFFHAPGGLGFHIRYRDMARGGVRVVPTRTQEQFELESNRLYDEVKGLAYAQQVKNKDIPEGGAKAVILLGPLGDVGLAVASVINSLLDVVLPGQDTPALPGVVDYLGREEIIYCGPDENIQPAHIAWMVERARQRDYRWPSAFMSSKAGAGINHKEYGVTSIGVMVFAEEMLRHLGIDPFTQPFTVKITGGPKGDVAGNLMRLMFETYGANARVVAVSDGHGAAWDPSGLDPAELLRLIDVQRSISAFDPARLRGEGAWVATADTPEGVRRRNTLHNTAHADIFIPSGGRPDTINTRNWHDFFDRGGVPTARAIIEGANLFVAPEARKRLAERGVLVVHGSSANKTGVICSSYEVLGGLVMTDEEFIAHKDRFVAEVQDILRVRARDEARLLLAEIRRCDGCRALHEISVEVSLEMNAVADALYDALVARGEPVEADPALRQVLLGYLPPVLVETFPERIFERIPLRHQYALVAAHTASRIVYAEGAGWLAPLARQRDAESVARAWLREDTRVRDLIAAVARSGLPEAAAVVHLLERGARKRATEEALGLE